jgi:hypothetical protein
VVEATAQSFQPLAQNVHLLVGQRGRLDFMLAIGGVAETVSVNAEAKPLLDSESAVLGTVVDQTSIANLPLAIRNWDDLLALVGRSRRWPETPELCSSRRGSRSKS